MTFGRVCPAMSLAGARLASWAWPWGPPGLPAPDLPDETDGPEEEEKLQGLAARLAHQGYFESSRPQCPVFTVSGCSLRPVFTVSGCSLCPAARGLFAGDPSCREPLPAARPRTAARMPNKTLCPVVCPRIRLPAASSAPLVPQCRWCFWLCPGAGSLRELCPCAVSGVCCVRLAAGGTLRFDDSAWHLLAWGCLATPANCAFLDDWVKRSGLAPEMLLAARRHARHCVASAASASTAVSAEIAEDAPEVRGGQASSSAAAEWAPQRAPTAMAKKERLAARRTEEQSVQPGSDKPNVAASIEKQVANPPTADLNMLESPPAKDLDKVGEVPQGAQLEPAAAEAFNREAFFVSLSTEQAVCVVVRLTKHCPERIAHLVKSPDLRRCCDRVADAGCLVQPEWAGGALLLVPLTRDLFHTEVRLQLQGHHVLLLATDVPRLQAALKTIPCRRRPQLRWDPRARRRDAAGEEGEEEEGEGGEGADPAARPRDMGPGTEDPADAEVAQSAEPAEDEGLEQQELERALVASREDVVDSEVYALLRLTEHSREMVQVLMASQELQPCLETVRAAGCELQPEGAGGALLFVPMTFDVYQELGVELESHHVVILREHVGRLGAALKALPRKRRPGLSADHRARARGGRGGRASSSAEAAQPAADSVAAADGEGEAAAEEAKLAADIAAAIAEAIAAEGVGPGVRPEDQIAEALDIITRQAREALRGVYELVDEPEPDSGVLALAYDSAFKADAKEALVFLRDVLVLKVCIPGGPWDNDKLHTTFKTVFDGTLVQGHKWLMGQLLLAFNTIVRGGRDLDVFATSAVKSKFYGNLLKTTPRFAIPIFYAYRACAETSPNFKSRHNSLRPAKRKPSCRKEPKDAKEPCPGNSTGQARSSGGEHEGAVTEGGAPASTTPLRDVEPGSTVSMASLQASPLNCARACPLGPARGESPPPAFSSTTKSRRRASGLRTRAHCARTVLLCSLQRGLASGCSLALLCLVRGAHRACLLRAVLDRRDVLGCGLAMVPHDALFGRRLARAPAGRVAGPAPGPRRHARAAGARVRGRRQNLGQ